MTFDSGAATCVRTEASPRAALFVCAREEAPSTENVELALDSDVINALYALGEDWEVHFNAILRKRLCSSSSIA